MQERDSIKSIDTTEHIDENLLENTLPYTKKRAAVWICLTAGVIFLIVLGIRLLSDRKYNLVSMMIVLIACGAFYLAYEKREGSIRRMVLLAVMTAISVVGRFIFGPIPFFKPVTAIVVLTGIYMGPESGFLVGSLSAVVSNIFFGQGPWTPFQMFSWGIIGMIAGFPGLRALLRHRIPLIIYGIFSWIAYSGLMDIWTVLSFEGGWNWYRYLGALATAVPVTITYCVSNVVFLMLTIRPIGDKMNRIQVKHGIF